MKFESKKIVELRLPRPQPLTRTLKLQRRRKGEFYIVLFFLLFAQKKEPKKRAAESNVMNFSPGYISAHDSAGYILD
jgi:hypothetical protein